MNLSRRNFIKYSALITGGALLGTAGYNWIGSINTTETINVKIDDIYIPTLPEQFNNFKIERSSYYIWSSTN